MYEFISALNEKLIVFLQRTVEKSSDEGTKQLSETAVLVLEFWTKEADFSLILIALNR